MIAAKPVSVPLAGLLLLASLGWPARDGTGDTARDKIVPDGAAEVAGVQGRHFIPLLPFLAFALPRTSRQWARTLDATTRWAVLGVAVVGAALVPALTVDTYLLR